MRSSTILALGLLALLALNSATGATAARVLLGEKEDGGEPKVLIKVGGGNKFEYKSEQSVAIGGGKGAEIKIGTGKPMFAVSHSSKVEVQGKGAKKIEISSGPGPSFVHETSTAISLGKGH